MDRLLRYGIDILAGLAGVLIGGTLVYMAVTNLIFFYYLYEMFTGDSSIPQVRMMQDIGKHTGQTLEGDPSWLVKPVLTSIAMLIAGLGLFAVGARGLFKRIAAGLPREEEGRAKSVTGRWASIAVFLFGIFIAGAGLFGSLFTFSNSFQMVFLGVDVEAELVEIERDPESERPGRPSYFATIQFTGVDGKQYEQKLHVGYSYGKTLELSRKSMSLGEPKKLIFRYVPGDPESVVLARYVTSPMSYIWFYVWRIAFVYVGVCGILRNLPSAGGASPSLPGRAGHADWQARGAATAPAMSRRPAGNGKGGQFGRRRA